MKRVDILPIYSQRQKYSNNILNMFHYLFSIIYLFTYLADHTSFGSFREYRRIETGDFERSSVSKFKTSNGRDDVLNELSLTKKEGGGNLQLDGVINVV